MATVDELKAKLAAIEAELVPLRAASEAAHIKTNQAQAALDAYYNTPGHISLNAKINAQKALAADPTNVQLQQNLASINEQWAKQSAELGPLLAARDAAFADEVKTRAPMVAKDAEAGQIELEIAKIDPSQATPDAVTYLKENGGLPITQQSDPALTTTSTNSVSSPNSVQTINPNSDPNTNIGADVQTSSPQVPVDDGSDPYVSNGNTTVPTIENESPATIGGEDPFEASRQAAATEYENTKPVTEQDVFAAEGVTNAKGLQGKLDTTRAQQITQDAQNAKTQGDWRVRLSLAKSATYLYKAENPGILKYLQATDGVVFPYTPAVQITYAANYEASDIVHSNYKLIQYRNSAVDQIAITCDFTAQDTYEANYLLAVIHFFKSVTKMFYGQDQQPKPGTPPPLCYLTGLGSFQFDNHPLVITNFNYNLPNDVDYIRAGSPTLQPGIDSTAYNGSRGAESTSSILRLSSSGLNTGAQVGAPQFTKATNTQPTYVPTKMQIVLSAYPMITRNDISNKFSLKDYATGSLLQGSRRNGGGIW